MDNELTKLEKYIAYIVIIITTSFLNILLIREEWNYGSMAVLLPLLGIANPILLLMHFSIWKKDEDDFEIKHIFLGALFWILFTITSRYLYQTFLV